MEWRRPALDSTRDMALLFLAIVVADLGTKWLAATLFEGSESGLITPDRNPNLALGILTGWSSPIALVLVFAGLGGVLVGMAWLTFSAKLRPWALTSFLAGATANLLDRLATGAVHDFLNLGVAVANVADIALLAGLVAFVVGAWRWEDGQNAK